MDAYSDNPKFVCEDCAIEMYQKNYRLKSKEAAAARRRRIFDASYLFNQSNSPLALLRRIGLIKRFFEIQRVWILTNAGEISHEVAEALALKEYDKFKIIQDKNYISDFDKEVKKILEKKKK